MLQLQMAVLVLVTLFLLHEGQSYEALLFSSESATSFRDLRPYLGPNRAADLLFLPFVVCFAMIITSVYASRNFSRISFAFSHAISMMR